METYRVCLFGHRDQNNLQQVEERLTWIIRELLRTKPFTEFLIGRSGEFDEYAASVDKANNSIDETANLCVQYEIVAKAPVAVSAIPRCNMVTVTGNEMVTQISGFYDLLFKFNPQLIGGALPDDNFYYKAS